MDKAKFKKMLKGQAYLDTGYFAKGRIKRMRGKRPKSTSEKLLEWAYKFCNQNKQFHYLITRWNRH